MYLNWEPHVSFLLSHHFLCCLEFFHFFVVIDAGEVSGECNLALNATHIQIVKLIYTQGQRVDVNYE